jgi:uncharacterized repeat protein (TIGR01451 family)
MIIRKIVTGPAADADLVDPTRLFDGDVTCRYLDDPSITTTWAASLDTPRLHQSILVESVCSATETPPGAGGQPVDGDPSYIWGDPVVGPPVTILAPTLAPPEIVVTNPTERLFGTFSVSKVVTGATAGIVDPAAPYPMEFECQPGTGDPITGTLEVPPGGTDTAGPEEEIPTGSVCTLTEALEGMPDLVDDAYSWGDPTFVADVEPVVVDGRTLTFTIPVPQEDEPEPNVAIQVTNTVNRTSGAWTIAKSSDPATGTAVQPGSTITYSLTVTSSGEVPVHDIVVVDDLAGMLPFATLDESSIAAPDGTTAALREGGSQLEWTVGTVPPATTLTLTYKVIVAADAFGVSLHNAVFGTGDDPPTDCAAPAEAPADAGSAAVQAVTAQATAGAVEAAAIEAAAVEAAAVEVAAVDPCSTTHSTPDEPLPAPPTKPVNPPASGQVPRTGFGMFWLAGWGALLLLAGALLVLASREGLSTVGRPVGPDGLTGRGGRGRRASGRR